MAYNRTAIDAYVREYIDTELHSSFIQRTPLLYFLSLNGKGAKAPLGQPGGSAMFGGVGIGKARAKEMNHSKEIHLRYETGELGDEAGVTYGGATPTASEFAEDEVGTIAFRWSHHMAPLKFRKHTLEMARGESEIASVIEEGTQRRISKFQRYINGLLWDGGMGSGYSTVDMNDATEQGYEIWKEPLGLKYTVGTVNNLYGRVDRSTETELNPFALTAGVGALASGTAADLDWNRVVNNGGTGFEGRANMNPNSTGCSLFITTSAIFNELAAQADARGIRTIQGGVPHHSLSGFKFPVIEHDNVYYTWDQDCPAGTMYCLDLDCWTMETRKGHNFQWTGLVDKSKTEEGGGYYEWGNYDVMPRLSCSKPWLQGTISGITV